MKHTTIAVVAAASLLAATAEAKLNVVTTTPDLGAIAAAIGGDHVQVKSLAKGYQDPHYLEAKPSFMRTMNRADLLVYTGLELEVGWLPLLIQGARNPRVASGASGHLDASAGVPLLEVPTGQVDRSMGDVHPEGNPHYMLDPRNGLVVASSIAGRLQALDPDSAEDYARNLAQFTELLSENIQRWQVQAAGLRGHRLVTFHKQWEYLMHWLGIRIVDQVEDKPGIPPSPRHIATLAARMRAEGLRVIVSSNFIDTKPGKRLAGQTDARLLALPISVGGEPDIKTYVGLFDTLVSHLVQVCSGS